MKKHLLATAATALALSLPAHAVDVAVGARISTLGAGLELATGVLPKVTLRGVINGFNYDRDFEDDQDNEYEAKLKLFTIGALADYHPFGGVFRLTGGALGNGFSLKGNTKDAQNFEYETDDFTYRSTNGEADAKFDFPSFAPYLGLGWGRPIKPDGNFWFSFDAGVMFQGSLNADLNLRGTGTVTQNSNPANTRTVNFATDPAVQQDIANYERELEDEAKDFKYYPVLGFGFGYKF